MDLHAQYSKLIIEFMRENVETGAPVNRPIWWISPNDSIALGCSVPMNRSITDGEPEESICIAGRSNMHAFLHYERYIIYVKVIAIQIYQKVEDMHKTSERL